MLAIVDDINAPSNDLFKLLTLSISRLISMTFLEGIDLLVGGCYIVFNSRAKLYFLACYGCTVFLTVGFDVSTIFFFLKSMLLSLLDAEYLVLTNLF